MSKHKEFPNFVEVSSVDVDAGIIWVGDPCYVLKDANEQRPTDLGEDWHGICSRFFERSGYRAQSMEWSAWDRDRLQSLHDDPEWIAWIDEFGGHPDLHKHGTEVDQAKEAVIMAHSARYEAEHPFKPTAVDKGFANFTHDAGHGGMGTAISTFYGDGTYPVFIEYGEGGRPRRVLIDFDPSYGEEDGDD